MKARHFFETQVYVFAETHTDYDFFLADIEAVTIKRCHALPFIRVILCQYTS